ncbi:nitroreductase family protein [Mollicutes bacterium LVI A0078]|nr:nitroreductase family protein [Mollicutes bacterium LVI A0075]WOO90461.1 nitroreductase family protein [Mollicutes bacterium LVI A0078]
MEKFQEILEFRYACKRFSDKEVTREDMDMILNAGIMAPSSCGIEQFRFVAMESKEAMTNIVDICMKQGTARTANKAIVVLAGKKSTVGPGTEVYNWHAEERAKILNQILPEEKQVTPEFVASRFDMFCDIEETKFIAWSKANSYLAAMNIMNQAASLGIDSCPIEGFVQAKFDEHYPQYKDEYEVALVITLGYRNEEPQDRIRLDFDQMVTRV